VALKELEDQRAYADRSDTEQDKQQKHLEKRFQGTRKIGNNFVSHIRTLLLFE
jgi:hypothetical protein